MLRATVLYKSHDRDILVKQQQQSERLKGSGVLAKMCLITEEKTNTV